MICERCHHHEALRCFGTLKTITVTKRQRKQIGEFEHPLCEQCVIDLKAAFSKFKLDFMNEGDSPEPTVNDAQKEKIETIAEHAIFVKPGDILSQGKVIRQITFDPPIHITNEGFSNELTEEETQSKEGINPYQAQDEEAPFKTDLEKEVEESHREGQDEIDEDPDDYKHHNDPSNFL